MDDDTARVKYTQLNADALDLCLRLCTIDTYIAAVVRLFTDQMSDLRLGGQNIPGRDKPPPQADASVAKPHTKSHTERDGKPDGDGDGADAAPEPSAVMSSK